MNKLAPKPVIVLAAFFATSLMAAAAATLDVEVSQNTKKLMPYQVFELTFQHSNEYNDPTWDVRIGLECISPSGKTMKVGGFFYGSSKPQEPVVKKASNDRGPGTAVWPCDPADLWKARFAPSELGEWKYRYTFQNKAGEEAQGNGTFSVVKGRVPQKGWVRINPENPVRLIFENGSPYYPIGFQDGVFDNNHNGSAMDSSSMEGPFRLDNANNRPVPPEGAMFKRGPSMNPWNCDVHFGRHARAGMNIWRFSPNNYSIKLFATTDNPDASSLDHVHWKQAQMIDEMLLLTRKYGMRNFYGIFGYTKVFNDDPENAAGMEKVRRLIKYSVDRWGAYVDFWEFLNEQKASTEWYVALIPYLRSIDPYRHPITTSWERPEIDGIELNAPHWYQNEDELVSDRVTADRARRNKQQGKPVIYGEQGNYRGNKDLSGEGIGGVWDPGSARRMRVRCWTAFFTEISFIFWETSYAKDGHVRNIWLGPEERQYIRALQDFCYQLDTGVKPVDVDLEGAPANGVRAYGLRSNERAAVYLHHFRCAQCEKERRAGNDAKHSWSHYRGLVKNLRVNIDVPKAAKGYWYDPKTANIIERIDVDAGDQVLQAPPFAIDLALLITNGPAPDIDGDGQPNDKDTDDDNDGVMDSRDAYPLEREEQVDADADRIGDNMDADVDADGKPDDRNKNGIPDSEETDFDGDGKPKAGAIPWDAFPREPKEWRDTDGDGIGDNIDPDDDGDGFSDVEEKRAGTDPLDAVNFP